MSGELATLQGHLCSNNINAHRCLYQNKDLTERFHNAQKLWGLNNGNNRGICRCVSGVISVIYATIRPKKGGQMKPQDVYKLEQVLRLSISQDLLSKASNFIINLQDDMEEARKIVEKKH
jgi:hypothetical protein